MNNRMDMNNRLACTCECTKYMHDGQALRNQQLDLDPAKRGVSIDFSSELAIPSLCGGSVLDAVCVAACGVACWS